MVKNISKYKKETYLIVAVLFQIALMITFTPANSYIMSKSQSVLPNQVSSSDNLVSKIISKAATLLVGFFTIKQIGFVSAASTDNYWCCKQAPNGGLCQPIPATKDTSLCSDSNRLQSPCSQTSECQPGTCIDTTNNICSAGVSKMVCDNSGGEWSNESIANLPQCTVGCCSLSGGAKKEFVTKLQCDASGGEFNLKIPQSQCVVYTNEEGACVKGDSCTFTTQENCLGSVKGTFYNNILCTNPSLSTNCAPTDKTTCGPDGNVYFVDNCSNIANVYDASKIYNPSDKSTVDYWSKVISPTCDSTDPSKCGLCIDPSQNYTSSKCGLASSGVQPKYGDYVCKSTTCDVSNDTSFPAELNRNFAYNQESWCVYEGPVGQSNDLVGSSYYVRYCDNGQIKTDICDQNRNRICGEKVVSDSLGTYSSARCRYNEGWKCSSIDGSLKSYFDSNGNILSQSEQNSILSQNKQLCQDSGAGGNSDCRLLSIDLTSLGNTNDDGGDKKTVFKFDVCVSKYTLGFDLSGTNSNTNKKSEDTCNSGTLTCQTIWRKSIFGNWHCVGNCNCLTQDFANQANELCTSLGDCGGYINVAGSYTKNFESYAAEGSRSKILIGLFNGGNTHLEDYQNANGDITSSEKTNILNEIKDVPNSLGLVPQYLGNSESGVFGGDALAINLSTPNLISDLGFQIGAGIVYGGVGALAGIGLTAGLTNIWNPIGWSILILAGLGVLASTLLGIGKTEKRNVSFTCQTWQPPFGGKDCSKCNDGTTSCTQYKCESLGYACHLETNTYSSQNPTCVASVDDHTAPIISYANDSVTSGYSVSEKSDKTGMQITNDGSGNGCLPELSYLNFTLRTLNSTGSGEFATCKWDYVANDPPSLSNNYNLEGKITYLKEGNYLSFNHTFVNFMLPLVSDLPSSDIQGDNPGSRTGSFSLYIRCADDWGNSNVAPYVVNLCIKESKDTTPATITSFTPGNGSIISYGQTSSPVEIKTNEPADCKWSLGSDASYDSMNDMVCSYDPANKGLGSKCDAVLSGLMQGQNNIYIKCKDQPWIDEDGYDGPYTSADRNVNQNGFLYVLRTSNSSLSISSVSVTKDGYDTGLDNSTLANPIVIKGGSSLSTISLNVKTTGGSDNGNSVCHYLFKQPAAGGDTFVSDFSNANTLHTQQLALTAGIKDIAINCTDAAGNVAQTDAIFSLQSDTTPPVVVRASKESGSLKIITDEDARCYYSTIGCSFLIDGNNSVSMDSIYSTTHSTTWSPGITYNIKCTDLYGNTNPGCAIILAPSF